MAMVACRDCEEPVAPTAVNCPKCGAFSPAATLETIAKVERRKMIMFVLFFGGFICVFLVPLMEC